MAVTSDSPAVQTDSAELTDGGTSPVATGEAAVPGRPGAWIYVLDEVGDLVEEL